MTRRLRAMILAASLLLWLTGACWLLVHLAFPGHNEFGPLPNPLEAPLMRLHGVIAVVVVFLFGWVSASHIGARWSALTNRRSGLWLLGITIVLLVSGYALYYTTGALHDGAAQLHRWLGVAALAVALSHWLGIRGAAEAGNPRAGHRRRYGRRQRSARSTTSSGSLTK
jgi:hypothetical protein